MFDFTGSRDKFVFFQYCKFCEHKNKEENEEPCDYCLENPVNTDSHRPIKFKDNGSLAAYLKKKSKESNNG